MKGSKLKEHLHQIAENVKEDTDLEDVYDQLALLSDIELSEQQVVQGEFYSQDEVATKAKQWLK